MKQRPQSFGAISSNFGQNDSVLGPTGACHICRCEATIPKTKHASIGGRGHQCEDPLALARGTSFSCIKSPRDRIVDGLRLVNAWYLIGLHGITIYWVASRNRWGCSPDFKKNYGLHTSTIVAPVNGKGVDFALSWSFGYHAVLERHMLEIIHSWKCANGRDVLRSTCGGQWTPRSTKAHPPHKHDWSTNTVMPTHRFVGPTGRLASCSMSVKKLSGRPWSPQGQHQLVPGRRDQQTSQLSISISNLPMPRVSRRNCLKFRCVLSPENGTVISFINLFCQKLCIFPFLWAVAPKPSAGRDSIKPSVTNRLYSFWLCFKATCRGLDHPFPNCCW